MRWERSWAGEVLRRPASSAGAGRNAARSPFLVMPPGRRSLLLEQSHHPSEDEDFLLDEDEAFLKVLQ